MHNIEKKGMRFVSIAVDESIAWGIRIERNGLFQLDLVSGECELITLFPDEGDYYKYGENAICYKYKSCIFCFPRKGEQIWVYDLSNKQLSAIPMECSKNTDIVITIVAEEANKLFAVAAGLNKILEIDIEEKKLVGSFDIIQDKDLIQTSNSGVVVGQKLYFVIANKNKVCEFNLVTKDTYLYSITKEDAGINTICYDGNDFWLSGKTKEIFRWDKSKNKTYVFADFPQDFGKYQIDESGNFFISHEQVYDRPIFYDCVCMRNTIWFIPLYANQIIYIDKDTCKLSSFFIKEEEENKSTWLRKLNLKYRLIYTQKNRYIVLYSYKYERYLKIDTMELTIEYMDMQVSEKNRSVFANYILKTQNIVYEDEAEILLSDLVKSSIHGSRVENSADNGKKIYQFTS